MVSIMCGYVRVADQPGCGSKSSGATRGTRLPRDRVPGHISEGRRAASTLLLNDPTARDTRSTYGFSESSISPELGCSCRSCVSPSVEFLILCTSDLCSVTLLTVEASSRVRCLLRGATRRGMSRKPQVRRCDSVGWRRRCRWPPGFGRRAGLGPQQAESWAAEPRSQLANGHVATGWEGVVPPARSRSGPHSQFRESCLPMKLMYPRNDHERAALL